MGLNTDAVNRHALGNELSHKVVHGGGLCTGAVDVVVVDVQLRIGIGCARRAQGYRNVCFAYGGVEYYEGGSASQIRTVGWMVAAEMGRGSAYPTPGRSHLR